MYSHQMLLPLDLPQVETHDFIHGRPNQEAWDFLCRYPHWPLIHTLIIGPKHAGKSTLAQSLAQKNDVIFYDALVWENPKDLPVISEIARKDVVIDNVEACPQTWLFHLINHQSLNHVRLIALTSQPLSLWVFEFLDLSSRLKTFYPITIDDVNDDLLFALLQHGLKKRGICCEQDDKRDVIEYLMRRMPRTYESIQHILSHLDVFLMEHHKRLTLPQAIRFLDTYGTHYLA